MERAPSAAPEGQPFATLALGVLGVVYGDIGTSPIYALHECFAGVSAVPATAANVLGVLSLVFWTLILVISLKYMVFVLRADNRGEGGTFALLALLRPDQDQQRLRRRALILLGIAGAATLYGGAMITPAISVLSATEGLKVAAPSLHSWVIPITVVILVLLFAVQRFGTARVGTLFGPVMVLWFLVLAALGIHGIVSNPAVLLAVNPWYAVEFFHHDGFTGFMLLFAVFLVTTGGEALYADLGHFGRAPIRKVWFMLVLPALLINYFGQGAMLIGTQAHMVQPFFNLAPTWALYPLVVVATAATCIASQATITGAYSMTRQAIQLGLLPRLMVRQTSAEARGQIYMPTVNWLMMIAAIVLVLVFRTSNNLAAAYGVAINFTMATTTILAFNVAREWAGWKLHAAVPALLGFLAIDLGFLASNVLKIPYGGWLPLAVGLVLVTIMTTWRRGSELLARQIAAGTTSLETFFGRLTADNVPRVSGTAVFFTGRLEQTPPALLQLIRHTGVLYERVILLTVIIEQVSKVEAEERMEINELQQGFWRLILHYGFMQTPNVPSDLANCAEHGLKLDLSEVHYLIGQVDMLAGRKRRGLARWRGRLFAWMARNTEDATAAYQIPSAQTLAVGLQIGI
ncbi:MAG TPA: KUP/HAK/KT family potassium transporter [Gammaproteobacteria bacterium]|nr:KUP/HAK/KT family potassium transporter [Gammaproteobacteria bacterium]